MKGTVLHICIAPHGRISGVLQNHSAMVLESFYYILGQISPKSTLMS